MSEIRWFRAKLQVGETQEKQNCGWRGKKRNWFTLSFSPAGKLFGTERSASSPDQDSEQRARKRARESCVYTGGQSDPFRAGSQPRGGGKVRGKVMIPREVRWGGDGGKKHGKELIVAKAALARAETVRWKERQEDRQEQSRPDDGAANSAGYKWKGESSRCSK